MEISKLKTMLTNIKVAATDDIIVYSRVSEDEESITFMSILTGFDIFSFLTGKSHNDISVGKVLKNTLSDYELECIKETGFALGLKGTFCVVSKKALIELCAILGLRGIILQKPSNERDIYIASALKEKMSFVYAQSNHPIILGVSTNPYTATTYFEAVNKTLNQLFGKEAFSSIDIKDGIAIEYRYRTKNGITPIIMVRDRINGTHRFELSIWYEIDSIKCEMWSISTGGNDIKSLLNELILEWPRYTKAVDVFKGPQSFDLLPLKEHSEFAYNKAMELGLLTIADVITFAKKHNIQSEIISNILKSVIL